VQAASRAAGCGIYLGQGAGGWAWAGAQRCVLVLGPSRSGKTSSLVITNILAAPGAVVSTSTKPEVLERTAAVRGLLGRTLLFDPSGSIDPPAGVERVGWSPLSSSHQWDGAMQMAHSMVRTASAPTGGRMAGMVHWQERATSLLAPLLHAAALEGEGMRTVLHWVDRHDGAGALAILARRVAENAPATDVLSGILTTDAREQSGIWSTASGVLAAYRSSGALASTEGRLFDAASFCDHPHSLFVCATGRDQQLVAPLVVGLLSDVRDAAYRRARTGAPDAPVLLALDELANIAPIPDLPALVSEGAGQGLLTLACLQDLSQARARWGPPADALVSLFGTTLVLGGIADVPTLDAVSRLAGDHEVGTRTISLAQGPDGRLRPSWSISGLLRPRLPVDVVARGAPGVALAIDARNRMGWVTLTPAFAWSPWRELSDDSRVRSPSPTIEMPVGSTGRNLGGDGRVSSIGRAMSRDLHR
jgi:type IV secretion system protein VirD4